MTSVGEEPEIASGLEGDAALADSFGKRLGAKFKSLLSELSSSRPILADDVLTETDATIKAAIADTFVMGELDASETEQSYILPHAQIAAVGKQVRLRLSDRARGDLLNKVQESARYRDILSSACRTDEADFDAITSDEVRRPTAWLRCFLSNDFGRLDTAPTNELRAAYEARERLRFVHLDPSVPSLEELRRQWQRAEFLDPLRILIGATGGWDGTPARDRFVGREHELMLLRSFVDELRSATVLESVSRSVGRAAKRIGDAFGVGGTDILFIEARGGLGKSALIAKFVIDHANGPSPFPFVYLDFDRASLQPREPRQLLMEAIRQVALQYPNTARQLGELMARIRSDLLGALQQSADPFAEFRHLLRDEITRGQRAFLLVLDTMEVAQYDPAAITGISTFLNALIGTDGFPELRVVAAGRASLQELRFVSARGGKPRSISLKPLVPGEARQMADRLGLELLGAEWDSRWAARLAGTTKDDEERREPLSVRVAVELIRGAKSEEREKVSLEIGEKGENANESFVGRLYVRRILHHIRDEEVSKLAWPGLVFRQVTKDIVREVLAGPCKLKLNQLDATFEALAREAWIVDRTEEQGIEILRHRRDLRARALPLMRRHEEGKRFIEINSLAIGYFSKRNSEPQGRAEWLYHRLLGGEPATSVASDWSDDVAPYLADAGDDFAAESEARRFLVGRTASTVLSYKAIASLPSWLAFEHLARSGLVFGAFDDRRIEPVVQELARRPDPAYPIAPSAQAARTTLLIKAGRWSVEDATPDENSPWWDHATFAQRYRRSRILAGDPLNARLSLVFEEYKLTGVESRFSQRRYRWLAQDLAAARITHAQSFDSIDNDIANDLDSLRSATELDPNPLRVAAIFGRDASMPATRAWAACTALAARHTPRSVSARELAVLARNMPALTTWSSQLEGLLGPWRSDLGNAGEVPFARIGDPKVAQGFWTLIERMAVEPLGDVPEVLRELLAARDEDWIVPFSYAAARAMASEPQRFAAAIEKKLASYDGSLWNRFWGLNAGTVAKVDVLDAMAVMRAADEASDLLGMAQLIEEMARDRPEASDLTGLIEHLSDWKAAVHDVLARKDTDTDHHQTRGTPTSPPRPGRITVEDDPQKNRWGGKAERDGRTLQVRIKGDTQTLYNFDLTVHSIDSSVLEAPVVFHLHPTFQRSVVRVTPERNGSQAGLYDLWAYGGFTVGVQVKRADGQWTSLEADLAQLPDLPERFRAL